MTKKMLTILFIFSLFISSTIGGVSSVKAAFSPSDALYFDRVKNVLKLTDAQVNMLSQYGFVNVEIPNMTKFEEFYANLVYMNDLPVIVTTDSILQMFHIVFDCSLRITENSTFYPILLEITRYAYNASISDYNAIAHDASQKYWAISNSTVYFAVALSLLTNTTVTVPPELASDEAFYLNDIASLQFIPAGNWQLPVPPYGVDVQYDFSQFKVRGHYVGDSQLESYFRAMMWYGQFPVFIPRNNETYQWVSSHVDGIAIVYIRDILNRDQQEYQNWQLLYNVTEALIGKSDSINLLSLETALHNVFGNHQEYLDTVTQGNGMSVLRQELSKPEYDQTILSQALVSQTSDPVPNYPLVFQFMGQRFVPDSYIFQNLIWDRVGYNSTGDRRILPKGLDLFAVLGSQRAYQLLTPDFDFSGYQGNLNKLQQEFNNWTEENWTYSSYTSWIHALQSLVNINYTSDYPNFMKTSAWQDEKLNTALGSWAQLRHDTILYAKQTYGMGMICSYPEAFLEPNPTFYARMQGLARQTLDAVNLLGSRSNDVVQYSLQSIANYSGMFEAISERELAKQPLTPDQTNLLQTIVQVIQICGDPLTGWYYQLLTSITREASYAMILEAPAIADVATFPPGDETYPPQILHVGTGYVDALVTLFPLSNGTFVTAVGPVFSYYEFPLIGTTRLNDNEWKAMLNNYNRTSYLPQWSKNLYALETSTVPENSALTLVLAPAAITIALVIAKRMTKPRKSVFSRI
jgi:hypothetical protein